LKYSLMKALDSKGLELGHGEELGVLTEEVAI